MNSGTLLQWATMGAFVALLVACMWAGRRARARALALALGLWAANGVAFYVALLGFNDGVITPTMVAWSALTRLQGIFLGIVALVIEAKRERGA